MRHDPAAERDACTHCEALQSSARRQATTALIVSAVALLLGVVVALAVFVPRHLPSGDAPAAAPEEATASGPAPRAWDGGDPGGGLVLECGERHADRGEFELALAQCASSLEKNPGDPLLQEKHDRLLVEHLNKQAYLEVVARLEQGDCESALIGLDGIQDPNSWAARQSLKEDLRGQARRCLEDIARTTVATAIASRDWDAAEDAIRGLEALVAEPVWSSALRSEVALARGDVQGALCASHAEAWAAYARLLEGSHPERARWLSGHALACADAPHTERRDTDPRSPDRRTPR